MKISMFACTLAACVALSGCATVKKSSHGEYETTIRVSATVDGSDRFIFTPQAVRYEHKFWDPATDVTFNGEPWTDLDHSPSGWPEFARDLDLSKARIVERHGRDVIALEQTDDGFDLYLCDSPGSSDKYDAMIVVPRRR